MTRISIFIPRNRYVIYLLILCCCSVFWVIVTLNNEPPGVIILDQLNHSDNLLLGSSYLKRQFAIQTEGCEIPNMEPWSRNIRNFVRVPNLPKCNHRSNNLLEHNKTHIWARKGIAQQYKGTLKCCYRAFIRTPTALIGSSSVDKRVRYKKCTYFTDHINVNDEFVRVTCHKSTSKVYDKFFLFAPKKHFVEHNLIKEIKNDNSTYNVLVMGIDGVSRLNLHRTLPKTIKYLKDNGAIELMGYNKVGENTFPNLIPMLLGISADELPRTCLPHKESTFDNCPFIWEWFKQAGYYTALAEDSSVDGTFNLLKGGFVGTPTDYYLHTFISEADKIKSNKFCTGDKYLYQMLLDYAKDVTTTLKSSRLFGFFWEIVLTHDDINLPAIMDDSYVKFLKGLNDEKYLEETILFLVSDHGMRFGEIAGTKQGRLESRLPFVFILAPPSFRKKYSEAFNNLKINSKRLTSPYNLYATFNDLANLDNINNSIILSRSKEEYWHQRTISLFLPIPGNRTCQLAGISDHWCTCHKDVPISKENALVKAASEQLIKKINKMLRTNKHCAKLNIEEMVDAREIVGWRADQDEEGWREVLVVVRTRPGDGVFEATLRQNDGGHWALAGQVGRLNLYGNQSYCVDDSLLKLFCYCVR